MGMATPNDYVGRALVQQIMYLAKQNEEWTKKRDSAKTQFKKDYYNKKIKKASEKAERLVMGLNKVNTRRNSTALTAEDFKSPIEELDTLPESPNVETQPGI